MAIDTDNSESYNLNANGVPPSVQIKPGLKGSGSIQPASLGGPGPIAYNKDNYPSQELLRNQITDYIRLRLGDGIVDVELDPAHYRVAIDRALQRYRQRSQGAEEESYVFLDLLPETQEYILPHEIMTVKQIYRRGIGSVTGTTASQFEPFASGYLNTYMLVAGRVGGLTNYELFASYQKLAMVMFGGYMNFTWNPVTKRLVLVRKMPATGQSYRRMTSLTADGTAPGSTITFTMQDPWVGVTTGSQVNIINCVFNTYNNSYIVQSHDAQYRTFTVTSVATLPTLSVTGFELTQTRIWSPDESNAQNQSTETVLLQVYNHKPDWMLFNDRRVLPWIQDYALAVCKDIIGQAREKFAQIAGPQGGTQLNGAALKGEAKAEMEALEEELKRYMDGAEPLTWIIG
jgi:hypothetical protein